MKKLSLSARIIAGYVFILALFGVVTVINFHLSDTVNGNTAFLIKSEAIIRNSAQLQRSIIDMENSFRGFLLTRDERFLSAFDSNAKAIPTLYNELQRATIDTSLQTTVLKDISILYLDWKDNFADPQLRIARPQKIASGGGATGLAYAAKKAQSNITDLIRNKFRQFNSYEYRLRNQRREALTDSIKRTLCNLLRDPAHRLNAF